jgi:diguanylate cyclase (GGDEF)-like protein/PAS domain S-box-containing protein
MMDDVTRFIETNQDAIIDKWITCPSLNPIMLKLNMEIEQYKGEIAKPVVEFFIGILKGENKTGDCPVMREIVETFHNKGLSVEDVFLNCTGLKNSIIELMAEGYPLSGLINILDHNLYNILAIYSKKIVENERHLNEYGKIINDHVLLSVTDLKGKITHVSDAFCTLTGYSKNDFLNHSHHLIRHPDMKSDFFQSMWGTILEGNIWKGTIINKKKDGTSFIAKTEIIPVKNESGEVVKFLAIRNDITDKERSKYDPLTQLFTRSAFEKYFRTSLHENNTLTLMMLDLDYFKKINDTFGHSEGDKVIKTFAEIFRKNVRENDICARWGGEEFLILLPDTKLSCASEVAERIRVSLEQSPLIDENPPSLHKHNVTCSIGVTEYKSGDTVSSMFERVDGLLYRAKKSGRNKVVSDLTPA